MVVQIRKKSHAPLAVRGSFSLSVYLYLFTLNHFPNHPRRLAHFFCTGEEIFLSFAGNSQEQATAGLGVKEEHLGGFVEIGVEGDVGAKVKLVVGAAAGEGSLLGIVAGARDEWDLGEGQAEAYAGSACHFPTMTEQAESGDVGTTAEVEFACERCPARVELGHPPDGFGNVIGIGDSALEGGCRHAKSQWFGQDQNIAWACAMFGQRFFRMNKAQHDEAIFGFLILDGVAASDNGSGFFDFLCPAAQDFAEDFRGEIGGHVGDVESEEGLAAHRVHIRQAVSRGNRAVFVGGIHDRSEKVGGDDEGAVRVETPEGRIVTQASEQVRGRREESVKRAQDLRQRVRAQFGRSTRTFGQAGEADFSPGGVFIIHRWIL